MRELLPAEEISMQSCSRVVRAEAWRLHLMWRGMQINMDRQILTDEYLQVTGTCTVLAALTVRLRVVVKMNPSSEQTALLEGEA